MRWLRLTGVLTSSLRVTYLSPTVFRGTMRAFLAPGCCTRFGRFAAADNSPAFPGGSVGAPMPVRCSGQLILAWRSGASLIALGACWVDGGPVPGLPWELIFGGSAGSNGYWVVPGGARGFPRRAENSQRWKNMTEVVTTRRGKRVASLDADQELVIRGGHCP